MVSRLVHEQAAALFHPCVPTTKIARAMSAKDHVPGKQPLEMHTEYITDFSIGDQFLEFGRKWCISVVEGNSNLVTRCLLGSKDCPAAFCIDCHGLFGNDIAAHLQGLDDVVTVIGIDCSDNHAVRFRFAQHRLKVFEYW